MAHSKAYPVKGPRIRVVPRMLTFVPELFMAYVIEGFFVLKISSDKKER